MLQADFFPDWEGKKSVALILLCLAMICFPFSVAATNISLGLLLAVGLLTGIGWQGGLMLWKEHRNLSLAIAAYLMLVLIGMIWSIDPAWGMKILGRHWFWLLLPIVVMVLATQRYRNTFLAMMSFGLTANLVFCVLQANGLIDSHAVAGSSATNATGHIGHTSFGFIYGIWAAWLLHLGMVLSGRYRVIVWGLALWALIMVFMAQGKSGYIVSLVLVLVVAGKWFQEAASWRALAVFGLFLIVLVSFILLGPAKDRFQGMDNALSGNVQSELNPMQENAVSSVTARLEWWRMSIDIWLASPVTGVGTGGFPRAVTAWQDKHKGVQHFAVPLVHPHNQYLLVLVRWGLIGLLLLLVLLYCWIRAPRSRVWSASVASPLVTLSGVALLVDGLSSSSLEEHFSTIFALLMLGVGLSEQSNGQ